MGEVPLYDWWLERDTFYRRRQRDRVVSVVCYRLSLTKGRRGRNRRHGKRCLLPWGIKIVLLIGARRVYPFICIADGLHRWENSPCALSMILHSTASLYLCKGKSLMPSIRLLPSRMLRTSTFPTILLFPVIDSKSYTLHSLSSLAVSECPSLRCRTTLSRNYHLNFS